ncbi:MAG: hypothetical protein ACO1QB_08590, partial [Verrucomicrobiales bacterium]
RAHTRPQYNHKIDQDTMKRIWFYSTQSKEVITRRIDQLDCEWDLERILETNAASAALTGLALGMFRSRGWLLIPACVMSFLLQHSMTRKSLPVQMLRKLGIRTRREIEAEKYALKLLRGDFDVIKTVSEDTHRAIEALKLTRMN